MPMPVFQQSVDAGDRTSVGSRFVKQTNQPLTAQAAETSADVGMDNNASLKSPLIDHLHESIPVKRHDADRSTLSPGQIVSQWWREVQIVDSGPELAGDRR